MPSETTDPLKNQIQHFVDVLRGITTPLLSGEEGLKTHDVFNAIQAAAAPEEGITLDNWSEHA